MTYENFKKILDIMDEDEVLKGYQRRALISRIITHDAIREHLEEKKA
jgi:hypothetical protein